MDGKVRLEKLPPIPSSSLQLSEDLHTLTEVSLLEILLRELRHRTRLCLQARISTGQSKPSAKYASKSESHIALKSFFDELTLDLRDLYT